MDPRLEELPADAPERRRVAVNAVVSGVSAKLGANVAAVRSWLADLILNAKHGEPNRIEVIADATESIPEWAG